ncbi:TIGR03086 family metal-binding protein [Modestobacter sp. VKM Ac-2983]|uniref:TIGR03086 family metal-binding protein n=1 Tax=Modestobacter sp. VKM Ac-2983 TaxID=3004137 RepID=UPI0022AB64AA|nr:TIGR03086 family metal-binding protein [Modestobacter sp. VKM Ac-2983]MCZ2804978.1 TIGR03086 family metal-binding protein [Modestobacter sp. VKM Ac-2983]
MTSPLSPPAAVRAASDLAATALGAVRPGQLTAPTPCGDYDVRALVDHLAWAALLSQRAATGMPLEHDGTSLRPAPFLDGVPVEQWAGAVPVELDTAADAWADPAAWEGETLLGTTPMPAGVVGPLMLAEFALHGWDLARAVGAPYDVPAELGEAVLAAVEPLAPMGRDGGWYGPAVVVPADAPAFDRALGLTGRDPGWRA